MVNPIDPSTDPSHIQRPSDGKVPPSSGAEETEKKGYSDLDPHGIWAKFLTTSSGPPSKEQLEAFIHSFDLILKNLVKQNHDAFERSKKRMKEAQDGE